MKKKTFLKGAAILGIAGLMVQVLGAVFRIPLVNIIGDTGIGYYQSVYPVYIFLLVFSTNGAPAAISKMTSERLAIGRADEAHRVFKLSFLCMAVFGLIASSAMYFFARQLLALTEAKAEAYYAMIAIAPALLFVPLMSVYRGYFQGMQDMSPTALSQFAEQIVRVATGLGLAVFLFPKGLEYAAAGATLGASIGPVAGIIILAVIYLFKRKKILEFVNLCDIKGRESARSILKTLAVIAVPITIGVSIIPIMNLADLALVMRRLKDSGLSDDAANDLYGQLTGMAGAIINIPMALALSMALSMVPAIAAACASKDYEFMHVNVRLGLRTSMIIGVPCCFGLIALAEPVMRLIYPLRIEAAVNASTSLAVLSLGVIFLCIAQTMAGILQGIGKSGLAVLSLAAGLAVKCAATYIFTAIPAFNIAGAAAGSVLGFVTIAFISFILVKNITKVKFDLILSVVKPLAAGIVMTVFVVAVYKGFSFAISARLATVAAVCAGAAAYGIALIKIKAITEGEITMLPKGAKLAKLLGKLKLL